MPAELTILTFEFDGSAKNANEDSFPGPKSRRRNTVPISEGPETKWSESICNYLNNDADVIAQEIERDVAKLLFRSSTQVKAEVRFYGGSILVQGSLIILSWLGSTILKSGKAAIEEKISDLVKVVVQRVINKALNKYLNPNERTIEPFKDIQVTSHPAEGIEDIHPPEPEIRSAPQRSDPKLRFIPELIFIDSVLLILIFLLQVLSYLGR